MVYNCYDEVLAAGLLMGSITIRFPLFTTVKQVLTWPGIECGPVLAPRRDLTEPEAAQKREALQNAGFYGGSVHPTDARLS